MCDIVSKDVLLKVIEELLPLGVSKELELENALAISFNLATIKAKLAEHGVSIVTKGDILALNSVWVGLKGSIPLKLEKAIYAKITQLNGGHATEKEIGFSSIEIIPTSNIVLANYDVISYDIMLIAKGEYDKVLSAEVFGVVIDLDEYDPYFDNEDCMEVILECMDYKVDAEKDYSYGDLAYITELTLTGRITYDAIKKCMPNLKTLDFNCIPCALNFSFSEDRMCEKLILDYLKCEYDEDYPVKDIASFKAKMVNEGTPQAYIEVYVEGKID